MYCCSLLCLQGRVTEVVPSSDMLMAPRQLDLVLTQPHALGAYIDRLQAVTEAGGEPLASVHVISCFSMNGKPHRALFKDSVNMLVHSGPRSNRTASLSGAIVKGLHSYNAGPLCDPSSSPQKRCASCPLALHPP